MQAAGQQAQVGLESLLLFMAVISINLGILNLLPIPILDGGHLLFFLVEAVMRRPLDMRHREIMQQVGLVILIGLMAFAFYNDILRVIRRVGLSPGARARHRDRHQHRQRRHRRRRPASLPNALCPCAAAMPARCCR